MIAAPRFVLLHLHKSGGTFANECVLRFVPGARQLGYHLPRAAIPAQLADRPMLGFVRSPWSYYVSWYAFQAARPEPNALFRVLSECGRLGFTGTIRNMLELGTDAGMLDAVIASLPTAYASRGLNLPGFALAPIRGSGLGFYAYLRRYMFGPDERVLVGRMEHLRTDLVAMLEAVGEPVAAPLRDHLLTAPPSNASDHGAYAGYYDAELRDLVAVRDADIIGRFGYRFGE